MAPKLAWTPAALGAIVACSAAPTTADAGRSAVAEASATPTSMGTDVFALQSAERSGALGRLMAVLPGDGHTDPRLVVGKEEWTLPPDLERRDTVIQLFMSQAVGQVVYVEGNRATRIARRVQLAQEYTVRDVIEGSGNVDIVLHPSEARHRLDASKPGAARIRAALEEAVRTRARVGIAEDPVTHDVLAVRVFGPPASVTRGGSFVMTVFEVAASGVAGRPRSPGAAPPDGALTYQQRRPELRYRVVVEPGGRNVTIEPWSATARWLGAQPGTPMQGVLLERSPDGSVSRYDLHAGTVAGGRLSLEEGDRMYADLTIFGSGLPVVAGERGWLFEAPR